MTIIGAVLTFIGFALLVWNLFVRAGKDRLPPYLCFRLSGQTVSEFPPGVVLTKRALYLWLSGGFWGLGSVLCFLATDTEFVLRDVSILAAVLISVTLVVFFLNLKTARERKCGRADEANEESDEPQD